MYMYYISAYSVHRAPQTTFSRFFIFYYLFFSGGVCLKVGGVKLIKTEQAQSNGTYIHLSPAWKKEEKALEKAEDSRFRIACILIV